MSLTVLLVWPLHQSCHLTTIYSRLHPRNNDIFQAVKYYYNWKKRDVLWLGYRSLDRGRGSQPSHFSTSAPEKSEGQRWCGGGGRVVVVVAALVGEWGKVVTGG